MGIIDIGDNIIQKWEGKEREAGAEKLPIGYNVHYSSDRISGSSSFSITHVPTDSNDFVFFLRRSLACHSGWSAAVRSQLTATSAFQAQAILLPQPPEELRLQACTTTPG